MSVRINSQDIHVYRKAEVIRDEKVTRARCNVQGPVVLELNEHRKLRGWRIRKIESHSGLYRFGLARWFQVDVQYQIVAWVEAPGPARGFTVRSSAWLPKEEVAVGIEGVGLERKVHAFESLAGHLLAPAAGARTIDHQICMVHHARIGRAYFDCFYETPVSQDWR